MGLRKSLSNSMHRGLIVKNLVQNGDFSDGTNGWTIAGMGSLSVENDTLKILVSAQNSYSRQIVQAIIGNKYYGCLKLKSTSNLVRFTMGNSIYHSGSGSYEKLSVIYSTTTTNLTIAVVDTRVSGWDYFYQDDVLVIDLTATFGAGNEPTKEQCDIIFSQWFDGTISIQQTLSANSPLRN